MGIKQTEESSLNEDLKEDNSVVLDSEELESVGPKEDLSQFTLAEPKKAKKKIRKPTPQKKSKKSSDKFTISQENSDGKSL